MNTTIWKATLRPADEQEISVPVGAELLSAREQRDQICVWFKCYPNETREKRTIRICGTGHEAPPFGNAWRFLGTVSLHGGDLMFHVFEKRAV